MSLTTESDNRATELDALDELAARELAGYIVRKDLVRRFKGQYPVPTYVGEFLLGRYCATTDEREIEGGWRSSSGRCASVPSEPARRNCSSRARVRTARSRSST